MNNNRNVELMAIGNELLVAQVLDTNSHWLIRNLTNIGAHVRRVQMLRDEYDEIAHALKDAVLRRPRLIITTGGLGPTDDDLTLRAISYTFGLPLKENPIALEMVQNRYAYIASIRPGYSAEINAARRKMAVLPEGALPIANPDGAAPAIALDLNQDTTLVCLPGVPREMKGIFGNTLQETLGRTVGTGGYVEHTLVLDRGDESRIADHLQLVQTTHPRVYVKSRGQNLPDLGLRLTVVLSCGGSNLIEARDLVVDAEHHAIAGLNALGYEVVTIIDS
jgi:molybdenum cofactor synthesis domain-containing protein